jgi:biopolymer transport protein ExbD
MATWDILHVKSLEVEHSVPEAKILEDLKEGRVSRDDCVRKPGEDRWWRIYEVRSFRAGAEEGIDEPPKLDEGSLRNILADAEPPPDAPRRPRVGVPPIPMATPVAEKPAGAAMSFGETAIGAVVEEPEEGLPYRARHHEESEELDMTPMVDVAMQLILFFMVTSSMIMQMCLSFPKPAPDENQRAQAQPTPQTLDDLKKDCIVVKIKGDNSILVDEEKVPTKDTELVAKLQKIKHDRNPNGGVVVQAEEAAYHETVVKVVDSANEARLEPIKMANPVKQAKKAAKKRAIK